MNTVWRLASALIIVLILVAGLVWLLDSEDEVSPEAISPQVTATPALAVAKLLVLLTEVEWRPSAERPWQSGITTVLEGNELRTSAAGQGQLIFFADTYTTLQGDTSVQVTTLRQTEEVVLRLAQGRLRQEVGEVVLYQVDTPHLSITGIRSTFEVLVENNQTQVNVWAGQVLVAAQGNTQTVQAGFMVRAGNGQALGNPAPIQTETPLPTATLTRTLTPTASFTVTASVTPTVTASLTSTSTATASLTITATATITSSLTLTPTHTASLTTTPTSTVSLTSTATLTSTPTATITPSFTSSPTATLRPSATLTPTSVVCMGRVTAEGGLFVREAPNPDAATILALPYDTSVVLLGQSATGNWYQIEHPNLPQGGWMASNLLETSPECRINLPIVQ